MSWPTFEHLHVPSEPEEPDVSMQLVLREDTLVQLQ